MYRRLHIFLMLGFALGLPLGAQTITTVAGNSTWGRVNNVSIDAAGNLYCADFNNAVVWKTTTTGVTTVYAGTMGKPGSAGDGSLATSAMLNGPLATALAPDGTLYISDYFNAKIRKVSPAGIISTFAGTGTAGFLGDGGQASAARINGPFSMFLDSKGVLYFVDYVNLRIRKIGTDGVITTVAGSGRYSVSGDGGLATATDLYPGFLAVTSDGTIYFSDDGYPNLGSHRLRKVSPNGIVSTVAGNKISGYSGDGGQATAAELRSVDGVALDAAGDIFIAETDGYRIRKVSPAGIISTYAGTGTPGSGGDGGPAPAAMFNQPTGLTTDASGNLFVVDTANLKIRKISSAPAIVSNGVVNGASFVSGSLVPGEIATVFGQNLTTGSGINLAAEVPLASQLIGSQVLVNGTAAPIFAVDNVNGQEQINFQVPFEVAGQNSATVQVVSNGSPGNSVTVPVVAAQPGIFTYTVGATTYGAILHANYQLANTASPAAAGETVLIYCTGLGLVSPSQQDGAAAAGAALTMLTPSVTIGGVQANIDYSGLAPGYVGLYQINVDIPAGLQSGNQPVIITMNGVQSSIALLPIQ